MNIYQADNFDQIIGTLIYRKEDSELDLNTKNEKLNKLVSFLLQKYKQRLVTKESLIFSQNANTSNYKHVSNGEFTELISDLAHRDFVVDIGSGKGKNI